MSARKTRSNSVTDGPSKQARRASIDGRLSLEDVKSLIQESENRIISKLECIVSRIDQIDKKIDRVQAEQVRLDLEMKSVKQVVLTQQRAIEAHEAEKRQLNLIFSGVPEKDIHFDDDTCLENDSEKAEFLCEEISADFEEHSIESCSRIGKPRQGQNRLLKVRFTDKSARNTALFSQKKLREKPSCIASFGRVFINKDSSPLLRKEEKRLRDEMHRLKRTASPDTKIFIRSGKLFCNSEIVDRIDIANQLW